MLSHHVELVTTAWRHRGSCPPLSWRQRARCMPQCWRQSSGGLETRPQVQITASNGMIGIAASSRVISLAVQKLAIRQ